MIHLRLLPVMAFLAFANLMGQTYQITGKVVNEANESIGFANVLLLSAVDSTFVQGTSADEGGRFLLSDIAPDLYLLQASYVGRGSKPLALDVKNDISLGALIIPVKAETLDEVVVTARRPTLERLSDRLVFNVENTVVSQGNSWDILKNTPGVIINQDDLQIRGQSATIYLNGRKVQLSSQEAKDLLEGLSGTNIKSVEVIANPPASFDAEGGPVLNIISGKNIVPGYKGSITTNYTQAVLPKYSFGMSHYYKTDKLNVFANYSFNPRKELRRTDKGINFINDANAVFSRWQTDIDETKRTRAHNGTLILDYDFDDKNSLNFTATAVHNPNQEWESNLDTEIRNAQNVLDSTFITDNRVGADNTNLAFDLSYVHKLKKEGTQLSFNTHYTHYSDSFLQLIGSDYFDGSGSFIRDFGFTTASDQQIEILTGQVDFATPLGTSSFESGLKISSIASESAIDYFNFTGNNPNVDASLSDDFRYDEKVYAAYVSWVKSWEKWSVKLGARGELTDAEGVSLTFDTTSNQDFFEIFPSIYLLYSPSEKHSFAFDYGRRVDRPRYNDLNPFRNFNNENDFEEGNLGLVPYFSNNFNLNYTFNSEFFIDAYYRDNGNSINYLVFQDNENQTLRELKQNVLESTSYGLDFTFSKSILNPWYIYSYVSVFHEDETFLAVESGDQEFKNEVNGVYGYLANYLTLSKDGSLTGEATITYLSRFLFGSYISDEQINLTLGLRKSLWNNRAVLSLAAEDILRTYVPTYTSRYLNQDNFYRRRPETQFVRFGFTYNFGNFRLEDNQRSIDKKERDRLKAD
ncbi:outer membrane beta-barrel protein [Allomuricauda sp. SCSIO 65647]|uniref:outer membrane beta-barrel protein n=1 Tax=Allomuricauda sp. SCSIO 65647 TaxID=2908843 RepID=UPI001F1AD766|nr:outer membrane beta-barrel protein [Muricauda sp. SCSIO 65647]UJH69103.1 TonB-dependent receptor family protein [Muricauda sp. SCSIO 65647]